MTAGPVLSTLLLEIGSHDLCLDASGNIAVAQPPYATAQDVASAIRTFLAEVWYDSSLGVQYQGKILGKNPALSFIRTQIEAAALSVAGVISATCTLNAVSGRSVTGQVTFTASNGTTGTIFIGSATPAPGSLSNVPLLTGSGVVIETGSGVPIITG